MNHKGRGYPRAPIPHPSYLLRHVSLSELSQYIILLRSSSKVAGEEVRGFCGIKLGYRARQALCIEPRPPLPWSTVTALRALWSGRSSRSCRTCFPFYFCYRPRGPNTIRWCSSLHPNSRSTRSTRPVRSTRTRVTRVVYCAGVHDLQSRSICHCLRCSPLGLLRALSVISKNSSTRPQLLSALRYSIAPTTRNTTRVRTSRRCRRCRVISYKHYRLKAALTYLTVLTVGAWELHRRWPRCPRYKDIS